VGIRQQKINERLTVTAVGNAKRNLLMSNILLRRLLREVRELKYAINSKEEQPKRQSKPKKETEVKEIVYYTEPTPTTDAATPFEFPELPSFLDKRNENN
jgi:hypothetical protein